jgi:biopolymer transport protein TolQ
MDALGVAPSGSVLSPVSLFLHADIIVKIVMLGLVAASVWTWTIIFSHGTGLGRLLKRNDEFEHEFWKSQDIDSFATTRGKSEVPSAKVLSAGVQEWRRSTSSKIIDREGVRSRLASVMGTAVAAEIDRLSDTLNVLATIGSVAPFVGLFGTVWGIMKSFTDIAASQNTSLGVVAPGIAEALFATALGLFAAIPAVIAYNRLTHRINKIESRLHRFSDGFHATLSRELERLP